MSDKTPLSLLVPKDVMLLLPGAGDKLADCKALAKRIGVGDRVIFPGHLADVERAYYAADLFVSASCSEGLPFAMMEAMRTGLPPVASAVAGQTDLVEQGINGLLYPRGDEKAYLAAVKKLMEKRRRTRLGQRAARSVRKYSVRNVFAADIAAFGYLRSTGRRKKR